MKEKTPWKIFALLLVFTLILAACGAETAEAPANEEAAPAEEGGEEAPAEEAEETSGETLTVQGFDGEQSVTIPTVEEGKTNVAFVYVGPIGDGGWTYAHNQGREYIEANGENMHTAYLESIPEGADAERVIRSLARQGFDVIFTTSFGYMDPTGTVAEEFPDTVFIHLTGQKKNDTNFGNVMGAMEEMKYLAGMVAGAKAAEDGLQPCRDYCPIPDCRSDSSI